MANSYIFPSLRGPLIPKATATNEASGVAYERSPEQALAQYAATGCVNATFYATDARQLDRVLDLAQRVSPAFVAKAAVYCRERGQMKDTPALLLAVLSRRDPALMDRVFDRVIDTPRMLRTFVQIVRSGVTGRKSLGSAPKRCVRRWLEERTDAAVFAASVGQDPSLADIVRMVRPKPATPAREALFGYLLDRKPDLARVPELVREFEAFKANPAGDVPRVPFQMLTGLGLDRAAWLAIACDASWQTTRMNLNTFARQGVFEDADVTALIAARLRDPEAVAKARVFPYQLLAALRALSAGVPAAIGAALEDAMELALANVPRIDGQIYICPDVSGSMGSPLTGVRRGATTAVTCVDVAALVASALLRRNPTAEVLPFEQRVLSIRLSANDSVTTNAARLAAINGGGTCVSAPLQSLNARRAAGDLVVIVSDNQSWADRQSWRGTETMREWQDFKARNPGARLALVDLQPGATTQAVDRDDILNVGGFSDDVFGLLGEFAAGRLQTDWAGRIEAIAV